MADARGVWYLVLATRRSRILCRQRDPLKLLGTLGCEEWIRDAQRDGKLRVGKLLTRFRALSPPARRIPRHTTPHGSPHVSACIPAIAHSAAYQVGNGPVSSRAQLWQHLTTEAAQAKPAPAACALHGCGMVTWQPACVHARTTSRPAARLHAAQHAETPRASLCEPNHTKPNQDQPTGCECPQRSIRGEQRVDTCHTGERYWYSAWLPFHLNKQAMSTY